MLAQHPETRQNFLICSRLVKVIVPGIVLKGDVKGIVDSSAEVGLLILGRAW